MNRRRKAGAALVASLALSACAQTPETDPTAQRTMIGLSGRDLLACMGGRPASVTQPAQATEIWTFRAGVTRTDGPPASVGTNFDLLSSAAPCDVRVVMTNGRVSQVAYAAPDGLALPSGRQCSFPVAACAALAGTR